MTATKERLNCDAVTETPQEFEYEARNNAEVGDEGPAWTHYPPYREITTVKEAHDAYDALGLDWGEIVDAKEGEPDDEDDRARLVEKARERLEESDPEAGWPQMNYFYPLPGMGDDEARAASLKLHLYGPCLCVVQVGDVNGLALTGGGMDLSWEICEAHILLGYLPPVHFCRLPRMSDRGTSKKDRRILARCRESCRVSMSWARASLHHLRESFPA